GKVLTLAALAVAAEAMEVAAAEPHPLLKVLLAELVILVAAALKLVCRVAAAVTPEGRQAGAMANLLPVRQQLVAMAMDLYYLAAPLLLLLAGNLVI
ncbi:MAG: hypothetical protein KGS72_27840, partial [Cyanobacteria bacterium REEB67]|nr:hypothetical protein [Cyanobacteria bacterium REEB67]